MAESFHLTVQFYSLFSLAFHLFSLFFLHPLESWKSLEIFCGSSGLLEEPSSAEGSLSWPPLSPSKASRGQAKGLCWVCVHWPANSCLEVLNQIQNKLALGTETSYLW